MVIAEKKDNTHRFSVDHIERFWDDEFKQLDYQSEPFNDPRDVDRWLALGYQPKFCGDMADMRRPQPSWNHRFIELFESRGWRDIGTSYYRMTSGTVMPVHQDRFVKYVNLFGLQGREHSIRRALIFLEPWKSGHYLEIMGEPQVGWQAGTVIEWVYDTPHMAANLGLEDRYTLQITGHL